jgi:hypothetical protein
MHTSAVDALLLRVLFVVLGTTMGVMGAQSLIFLLRSCHIWDAPPITSALSSLGGASIFGALWLFVARVGPGMEAVVLSPTRRRVLVIAILLFILTTGCILAIVSFMGVPSELLHQITFSRMLGLALIAHGAGATMLVELIRVVAPRTSHWSDRQHFTGVGVAWVLLSAMSALYLWQTWPKLTWP